MILQEAKKTTELELDGSFELNMIFFNIPRLVIQFATFIYNPFFAEGRRFADLGHDEQSQNGRKLAEWPSSYILSWLVNLAPPNVPHSELRLSFQ